MTMRRRATPPAVIDDLVDRIAAVLNDPSIEVKGYWPGDVPPQQTRVYVVAVDNLTRNLATQQGAREETYTLALFIQTHAIGRENHDTARDQWWAILEALEADLFDDPEVGLADAAGVVSVPNFSVLPGANQDWVARGTVDVGVTATI